MDNLGVLYSVIFHPNSEIAYNNPIVVTHFNTCNLEKNIIEEIKNCNELDILYDILAKNNINYDKLDLQYYKDIKVIKIIDDYKFTKRYVPKLTKEKITYFLSQSENIKIDMTIYDYDAAKKLTLKSKKKLLDLSKRKITHNFYENLVFNKDRCIKIMFEKYSYVLHVLKLLGHTLITNDELLVCLSKTCYCYEENVNNIIKKYLETLVLEYCDNINNINENLNDYDEVCKQIVAISNLALSFDKNLDYRYFFVNYVNSVLPFTNNIIDNLNNIQNIELFLHLFKYLFDLKHNKNTNINVNFVKLILQKIASNEEFLYKFITNYLNNTNYQDFVWIPEVIVKYLCENNHIITDIKIIENLLKYVNSLKICDNNKDIKKYKKLFSTYNYVSINGDAADEITKMLCNMNFRHAEMPLLRYIIKKYKIHNNNFIYVTLLLHLSAYDMNLNNKKLHQDLFNALSLNNCTPEVSTCNNFLTKDKCIMEDKKTFDFFKSVVLYSCNIILNHWGNPKLGLKCCNTCLINSISYSFTQITDYVILLNENKTYEYVDELKEDFIKKIVQIIRTSIIKNNSSTPIQRNIISKTYELAKHLYTTEELIDLILINTLCVANSNCEKLILALYGEETLVDIFKYNFQDNTFLQKLVTKLFSCADMYTLKPIAIMVNNLVLEYIKIFGIENEKMIGNYITKEVLEKFYALKLESKDLLHPLKLNEVFKSFDKSIEPKITIEGNFISTCFINYADIYIKSQYKNDINISFFDGILKHNIYADDISEHNIYADDIPEHNICTNESINSKIVNLISVSSFSELRRKINKLQKTEFFDGILFGSAVTVLCAIVYMKS